MKVSTLTLIRYLPLIILAGTAMLFSSCTGPAGPTGEEGTTSCKLCHHDSTDLISRTRQWQLSRHATGSAFLEADRTTCAGCHTSEGYHETIVTGADTAKSAFANPTTINCRTCHKIHMNYDLSDWNLTYTSPVALRFDNHQTTVDYKKGNLCAKCHQARPLSPPVDESKDSLVITNLRWGPHYGPQANILWGTSAFELSGTLPSSQAHKSVENACLVCHMATPVGVGVGGHTFNTARIDEETGALVTLSNGCMRSGCHTKIGSATNVWDPNGGTKVTDMVNSLTALRTKLAAKGWLDTTQAFGNFQHDYVKATSSKPLRLSKLEAKVLANYLLVAKDKSKGIHNPQYVTEILRQSLAAIP